MKKVHSRERYMGKKREFEKCRESFKKIQRKDECKSSKIRENRYGRGKRLQEGRTTMEVYSKNVVWMG